MGQPIVVTEKPSAANRGVIRFETSRMLTGMGHERYRAGDEIFGDRPPDELARRLLVLDSVAGLHVHGNMITVDLNRGYEADGVRAVIEDLYVFYPENLVNPDDVDAETAEIDAGADEAPVTPEVEAVDGEAPASDAETPGTEPEAVEAASDAETPGTESEAVEAEGSVTDSGDEATETESVEGETTD